MAKEQPKPKDPETYTSTTRDPETGELKTSESEMKKPAPAKGPSTPKE